MKTKVSFGLVLVLVVLSLVGVLAGVAAADPPAGNDPAAGGMFVIGDQNAVVGSTVTFWGAQWWKLNSLTGGSAPPSFKGYALSVAPDCGGFTTAPGNSAPPPAGPLSDTIEVLVTDSVQKTGNTISGTVTGTATVRVDPGYDADPGHAGTGTVMSVVGCGGPLF